MLMMKSMRKKKTLIFPMPINKAMTKTKKKMKLFYILFCLKILNHLIFWVSSMPYTKSTIMNSKLQIVKPMTNKQSIENNKTTSVIKPTIINHLIITLWMTTGAMTTISQSKKWEIRYFAQFSTPDPDALQLWQTQFANREIFF